MQAGFKAVVVWFVLIAGISIFPVKVWALPEEVFTQFLEQGRWSEKADDNNTGENLSSDLIKRIVIDYRAHPKRGGTHRLARRSRPQELEKRHRPKFRQTPDELWRWWYRDFSCRPG
jgi:hypothetical protein